MFTIRPYLRSRIWGMTARQKLNTPVMLTAISRYGARVIPNTVQIIAEMERRLRARGIKVIVYDDEIPLRYYTIDFIHLTREGHAMIAAALLPRVMTLIERRRKQAAPSTETASTKNLARN